MLNIKIDQNTSVLTLTPNGQLTKKDFEEVARKVDQYLDEHSTLSGVVINANRFPGWENLGGLIAHLKFVRDHHRKINRVAMVSDNEMLKVMPSLMKHFVAADVKHFAHDAIDDAFAWVSI